MKLILRAIKELEHRAKKIHNRFSFKKEETMKKQVAKRNALDFEGDVDSMLSASNELLFITTDGNQDRANEVLKSVQKLLIEGTKIILNQGTNEEMNELVMKETQNIIDLLIIIKDEEEQFKPFIKEKKHFFSEKWFLEIAKKIQISNDVSVFINELNGGDIAFGIKKELLNPNKKEINLYGIDRDIDCGAESRQKGIETARGGIYEASSYWADISFCANHYISFEEEYNYHSNSELHMFYQEKMMRTKGIFIFNYPYYRVGDIKSILNNNELIATYNINDALGNILFVMKYGVSNPSTKNTVQKIQFESSRIPYTISNVINYYAKDLEEVKTFRGKYTDLDDIRVEFKNHKDSAQFVFDYFQPENKIHQMGNPLIEYKPGQIPMMATSGVINGRYVDEILTKKVGRTYGFDHIFSTKIVKKEIEEKEIKIDKDGNEFVEISEKKNNVIISTALTAHGEYIELFSNETVEEDKEEEKKKIMEVLK